jgi:hypothetical protein
VETRTITERHELGSLWLPWCVDREDPRVPIRIADQPMRIPNARQLRVGSIDDPRVRQALALQVADGGFTLAKIDAIVSSARNGRRPEIPDAVAFRVPDGLTLMEGCHRICALYLLDPAAFDLRLALVPEERAWPVYFDSRLRNGG